MKSKNLHVLGNLVMASSARWVLDWLALASAWPLYGASGKYWQHAYGLIHANANANFLAAARRSRVPGRARMPVH